MKHDPSPQCLALQALAELDPEQARRDHQAHLQQCPDCRELVDAYTLSRAVFDRTRTPEPKPERFTALSAELMNAIRSAQPSAQSPAPKSVQRAWSPHTAATRKAQTGQASFRVGRALLQPRTWAAALVTAAVVWLVAGLVAHFARSQTPTTIQEQAQLLELGRTGQAPNLQEGRTGQAPNLQEGRTGQASNLQELDLLVVELQSLVSFDANTSELDSSLALLDELDEEQLALLQTQLSEEFAP
ncbi:MAG: hypothetical protein RBU37_16530 [Myxococcota bacterium]|jgi:hypothetical protein|nr:hypothetical protein [Myxococcota bacterium]